MSDLFSLPGAVTVGCLGLAVIALETASRLFFSTLHEDTSGDGAFGLGVLGVLMIIAAGLFAAMALHAAFH
jgi:hypothetical protein